LAKPFGIAGCFLKSSVSKRSGETMVTANIGNIRIRETISIV